jgi:KH domain
MAAASAPKQFLHGGGGFADLTISLNDQAVTCVIGKGGTNKADLRRRFSSVTIAVESKECTVHLRGPRDEVEACRIDVLRMVASRRVSEPIHITSRHRRLLSTKTKFGDIARDLELTAFRGIPVNIAVHGRSIMVHGYAADVRDAVALLNWKTSGTYESRVFLPSEQFAHVKNEWSRQSTPLQRAKEYSGASVTLGSSTETLVFRGKPDQVKAAKLVLYSALVALLGPTFSRMVLTDPLVPTVGRVEALAEVSAVSGATIQLDRDTSSLLVFSTDAASMEKAAEMLNWKIYARVVVVVVVAAVAVVVAAGTAKFPGALPSVCAPKPLRLPPRAGAALRILSARTSRSLPSSSPGTRGSVRDPSRHGSATSRPETARPNPYASIHAGWRDPIGSLLLLLLLATFGESVVGWGR